MKMNLTLRQQIFLSFIVMISFTIIVSGYAIWSLKELNDISTDIIVNNSSLGEYVVKLSDNIMAQDLYEKRTLTYGHAEAEVMFWNRGRELKTLIAEVGSTAPPLRSQLEALSADHDRYTRLFTQESILIKKGLLKEAEALSSTNLKAEYDKVLLAIKGIDLAVKNIQKSNMSKAGTFGPRALMITIMLSVVSLVFGIVAASLLTGHLTSAINRLKEATHSIRRGDFDNLPEISGADELTDLAISFKEMTSRLKELEATHLDANPLTKLPGNLAIEKELLTRLNEPHRFSFCLADLDNFKAFNDRYGFARGSDVIKWLGNLLSGVLKELGSPDDFLGHIGGDDYVIMCAPERVEAICGKIVEEYDKGIPEFYDPEDRKKGFILSIDRNDKPAIFGIMTISIAVVNTDRTLIREPKEVGVKVTELKQYAKKFPKSLYVVDRRKTR